MLWTGTDYHVRNPTALLFFACFAFVVYSMNLSHKAKIQSVYQSKVQSQIVTRSKLSSISSKIILPTSQAKFYSNTSSVQGMRQC